MNIHQDFHQEPLRRSLVERLRPLQKPETSGLHHHASQLFSYCAIERERIVAVRPSHPLLGIVLRGHKEVWLGDQMQRFSPGCVFSFPVGVAMDVVNIPAEASGMYESLLFEIDHLPKGVATLPAAKTGMLETSFAIPLTDDLVEALAHAGKAIADMSMADEVKQLRLAEVLALLRTVPAARHIFRRTVAEDVAWHIRCAPSETWTAEMVAERLGIGESTLRRRLAGQGASFRQILRQVRMSAARDAVEAGATSFAAAEAVGYVSRSHFSRRFREAFGNTPTGRA